MKTSKLEVAMRAVTVVLNVLALMMTVRKYRNERQS